MNLNHPMMTGAQLMALLPALQTHLDATLHLPATISEATFAQQAITSITTDSRRIQAGDWFVALRGDTFDGHDFLETFITHNVAQPVGVMIDLPLETLYAKYPTWSLPVLQVCDTLAGLQALATVWRQQFTCPIIAVTGSNGKTTVKEMLASIVQCAYPNPDSVLATQGNLNNHIGVPLTLLQLRPAHQIAVIECGMNHIGEIAVLGAQVQPTVALVNNAQREHLEFMGSVAEVAKENGSIFKHLAPTGVAVFPADDDYASVWYDLMTKQQKRDPAQQIHTFSLSNTPLTFTLNVLGKHHQHNALAAMTCARAAGIAQTTIEHGLANFHPVAGRMRPHWLSPHHLVIDDTYNANPDSMRAGLQVLAELLAELLAESAQGGVTIAVLGDMGEVGHDSVAFHREIGAFARQLGITHLFAVGEAMRDAVTAFNHDDSNGGNDGSIDSKDDGHNGQHFASHDALIAALLPLWQSHLTKHSDTAHTPMICSMICLVKGSRFMRMEQVVNCLLEESTPQHAKVSNV
jgi:UDP-N-acetylmuramoyl-tripeptide--D-alanyl-D-alanine ligase